MKKTLHFSLIIFAILFFIKDVMAIDYEEFEIHGFISQGALVSDRYNFMADTADGTFQFAEVGVNFTGPLTDKLKVGMQLMARDLGDIGNMQPYIDWATADYRWKGWLGIRAGQMKMAYGFYNDTRDLDTLRTSILLPTGVYIESFRDAYNGLLGAGLYGYVPVIPIGGLSYQVAYGSMHVDPDGGTAKMFESATGTTIDKVNMDNTFNGSLQWSFPFGLRIGSTYTRTGMEAESQIIQDVPNQLNAPLHVHFTSTIDVDQIDIYTLSSEYTFKDLILAAEYYHLELGTNVKIPQVLTQPPSVMKLPDTEVEGYYVSASYRFTDWFELGGSYSWSTNDSKDKNGENRKKVSGNHDYAVYLKDYALSTRFDINEFWTVKLEGHMMQGHAFVLDMDNPLEVANPNTDSDPNNDVESLNNLKFPEKDWYLFAAKLSYSF